MSNNLGLPTLVAGAFAEHPFNDSARSIDAALTSPIAVNLVPGNVTLTALQWRSYGCFAADPGGNAGRRLTVPAVKGARIFRNVSALQPFNVASGSTLITVAAQQTVMIYNTGVAGRIYVLSSFASPPAVPVISNFVTGGHTVGGSSSSYGALYTDPGTGLSSPTRDSNGMHHSTGTGAAEGVDLAGSAASLLIGTGLSRTIFMEFVCPSTPTNKTLRFAVVNGGNFIYLDILDDGAPLLHIENQTGAYIVNRSSDWTAGATVKLGMTIANFGGNDRLSLSIDGSAKLANNNTARTGTYSAGTASLSFTGGSPAGGPQLRKFGVYEGLFGTDLDDLTT